MTSRDITFAAAGVGGGGPVNYVDDVFSTYLYTTPGGLVTITNGIDLAGEGGLVWEKSRSGTFPTFNHQLGNTDAGLNLVLESNTTAAQAFGGAMTPLSNGYSTSKWSSGINMASWTFRKAPKFFDVVTYTGDGSVNREISHNLGVRPGMIIVKATSATSDWYVWHRNLAGELILNKTDAVTASFQAFFNGTVTSSFFSVSDFTRSANSLGVTYVAYLFAHNAGGFGATGTDNVISCGSFTGASTVNLGYEPQYILWKNTNTSEWYVLDTMRGWSQSGYNYLLPNTSGSEEFVDTAFIAPTATGFNTTSALSGTWIYMAIRRPMKPPTVGTSVFSPVAYTGNGSNRSFFVGFPTDLSINMNRDQAGDEPTLNDRLRGLTDLYTSSTQAETTTSPSARVQFDNQTNIIVPSFRITNTIKYIDWCFRRAATFLDIVCYTGTGVNRTVAHNLTVVPELMIVKRRSAARSWAVYANDNTAALFLNETAAFSVNSVFWNNTTPTSSVFSVGTNTSVNTSGSTYVAYLFASVAGVSKVGSYTGTGTTQVINCAFTTGARFVLIKRTDDVGDWFVWDTARGMVSGTDPRLAFNLAAGEINNDWVFTATNGFQIVTTDATINASGGSYIYLAIA